MDKLTDVDSWRWYSEIGGMGKLSVTTILSNAVANIQLNSWFKKTSEKKIATTVQKAADFSTLSHEYFEKILKGVDFEVPETHRSHITNFRKWVLDNNVKALHTEITVTSDKYGYCGTIDCIASIGDEVCVIDWKTGNRYSITNGYQLAAYRQAAIEMGLIDDKSAMMGVQIARGTAEIKTFKYEHIEFCLQKFLCALEIFKGLYFHKLLKLDWKWLKEQALRIV